MWQPYATAVALGLKCIETRSWSTSYRGPLAIHAGKHWQGWQQRFAAEERAIGRLPAQLPLGAFVAVAELVDCMRVEEAEAAFTISPLDRRYGDYSAGRYAWILGAVRALATPAPFPGRQGLFRVPAGLLDLQAKTA